MVELGISPRQLRTNSTGSDEFELKIGHSLRRKIDKGTATSRFGVVVLSPAFFGRGWPEYELNGLTTQMVSRERVLLPVRHNVTGHEVMAYSPSLVDLVALSTATHTVEAIAAEIVDVIRNNPESQTRPLTATVAKTRPGSGLEPARA